MTYAIKLVSQANLSILFYICSKIIISKVFNVSKLMIVVNKLNSYILIWLLKKYIVFLLLSFPNAILSKIDSLLNLKNSYRIFKSCFLMITAIDISKNLANYAKFVKQIIVIEYSFYVLIISVKILFVLIVFPFTKSNIRRGV